MPNKEKQFIIRPSYTKIRKSRNVIPNKENVYFRNKITLNTGENTNIKTLMQTNIDKLSKNKSHVEHVYVDTNIMNSIENHNEYIENIEIDEIFEPNDVNVEIHHGKQLILDIKKEKLFMDGSKSVYKYSKYITLPFSVDQKTVTVKFTPGFIKIRGIHKKRIDEMHDDNIMLNYD
ncbi:hypothetical protein A3Q56_03899 [Intoshia linei]|uniref:SHSP domain-containing protein n=1 Tax=Intoshia linei TaxID=1819745 RepID=A0A177B3Q3_9BILA|nr:hypothetical protein A3Q56_03899 [Intoshia linei]